MPAPALALVSLDSVTRAPRTHARTTASSPGPHRSQLATYRLPLASNGWLSQRVQSPSAFDAHGTRLFALLSVLRAGRARRPTLLTGCGEIAGQCRPERAGQHAIAAALAAHDAVDLELLQVLAHHRARRADQRRKVLMRQAQRD